MRLYRKSVSFPDEKTRWRGTGDRGDIDGMVENMHGLGRCETQLQAPEAEAVVCSDGLFDLGSRCRKW